MNKILSRENLLLGSCLWKEVRYLPKRTLVKDTDKDKDKEDNLDEKLKARQGVLHDKTQSIQEESYFHKEEVEQLKALKEKAKQKKDKKEDN